MKITKISFLAVLFSLVAGPAAWAQEWSPAQKEVWSNVETYMARSAAGDVEGLLSYVHDDYTGWDISEPMTSSKARLRKFTEFNAKIYKTELADLQPVAINVVDDVAIAYYHFTTVTKDSDGKRIYVTGRYADVLKKQGDRWVLIGDHGGVTSEE